MHNLVQEEFPPPYLARIERIYKLVYENAADDGSGEGGEETAEIQVDALWMWTLPQTLMEGMPSDPVGQRGTALERSSCARRLTAYPAQRLSSRAS